MAAISVQDVQKRYAFYRKEPGLGGALKALVTRKTEYVDAVCGISFAVEAGEVMGFLGPNGAGKTTTLKMLSGILYPSAGALSVLGHIPQDRSNEFKRQIGLVMGQKDQLIREIPARDNFALFKALYGLPESVYRTTSEELISLLGIESILDVPIRKLSLGQRMKCELVAALLHKPQVLFLDEPTIGLDVVAQKNIRDFITRYNEHKRTTILLTSHYMDDVRHLCERVIIINTGRLIYDGPLTRLIDEYAKEKTIVVSIAEPVPQELLAAYGEVASFDGVRASICVPRSKAKEVAGALIGSSLPIDDILIEEMSVDDIVRAIFGEHHHTP